MEPKEVTLVETFYGIIHSTLDALLIFEACLQNKLPRVQKRLQEKERASIRSGSVFVFEENESGIKRWTDGKLWSPSRILDNFLIYREVERKISRKKGHIKKGKGSSAENMNIEKEDTLGRLQESALEPSSRVLSNNITVNPGRLENQKAVYILRKEGLVKKTISVMVQETTYHLVCYYTVEDYCQVVSSSLEGENPVGGLCLTSRSLQLTSVLPRPELLMQPNWRKPPEVDDGTEGNGIDELAYFLSCEPASGSTFSLPTLSSSSETLLHSCSSTSTQPPLWNDLPLSISPPRDALDLFQLEPKSNYHYPMNDISLQLPTGPSSLPSSSNTYGYWLDPLHVSTNDPFSNPSLKGATDSWLPPWTGSDFELDSIDWFQLSGISGMNTSSSATGTTASTTPPTSTASSSSSLLSSALYSFPPNWHFPHSEVPPPFREDPEGDYLHD